MIRKHTLKAAIGAATLVAGVAQAEAPSLNEVEIGYVLSGDTEISVPGTKETLDLDQGYSLKGSFEVGEYVLVSAETLDLTYEDDVGLGTSSGSGEPVVFNDYTFIGAGGYMPFADQFTLYGQVGIMRPTFFSFDADGFGVKLGAKASFEMVEIGLSYQTGNADLKVGPDTLDVDPTIIGLDVALSFSPDWPQAVLSYADAKFELDGSAISGKADVEFAPVSLGIRQKF